MSRQKSTKRLRHETKGRGSRETAEPDIANMARPMTHLPLTSFVRLSLGRPDRRPGSWSRMMSSKRLKTRARRGRRRNFHNQAFQKFTDATDAESATALALSVFHRYISPTFPEKTASKTR